MQPRQINFLDVVNQWLIFGFAFAYLYLIACELLPETKKTSRSAIEAKAAAEDARASAEAAKAAAAEVKSYLKDPKSWTTANPNE